MFSKHLMNYSHHEICYDQQARKYNYVCYKWQTMNITYHFIAIEACVTITHTDRTMVDNIILLSNIIMVRNCCFRCNHLLFCQMYFSVDFAIIATKTMVMYDSLE